MVKYLIKKRGDGLAKEEIAKIVSQCCCEKKELKPTDQEKTWEIQLTPEEAQNLINLEFSVRLAPAQ